MTRDDILALEGDALWEAAKAAAVAEVEGHRCQYFKSLRFDSWKDGNAQHDGPCAEAIAARLRAVL